ncbi:MAG TPA: hypothetical protein VG319_06270, partial [Polyangia bacterium]|nr:hypothetical protein [Polyangia bacterium]
SVPESLPDSDKPAKKGKKAKAAKPASAPAADKPAATEKKAGTKAKKKAAEPEGDPDLSPGPGKKK